MLPMSTITDTQFANSAADLKCSEAAIRAVAEVESGSMGGFSAPGRPVVLFEGHWFHRYTKGKYAASHPSLCYPKWTKVHYAKNQNDEWARLQAAMALDKRAALMSASYGRFQVMGFNFAICGWKSVELFFAAMCQSEDNHLEAFEQYVRNSGLSDELQRLDWDGFAHGYNGPEYRKNDYAGKMWRAHARWVAKLAIVGRK